MDKDKINSKYIKPFEEAWYVALTYFTMSIVWIIISDEILLKFVSEDTLLFKRIQTYKGVTFVFISSVIVFFMVYHRVKTWLKLTEELDKHKRLTQAKIDYIGLHDSLTGLPKRLLLEKRFLTLIENSHKHKNIGLIHLDISNFTQINEILGNMAGDQYILHISKVLEEIIKGNDLLARISQDAFAILLTDIKSKEDIDNQVRRIFKGLEKHWFYDGREFDISAIAGISTYPEDCLEFYCLLRYSNIALRYAKLTNKERFEYYSKDTETRIINNLEIVDRMKKALANNEFSLNYQIILDLLTREVKGVETLIRWVDPEKGNIPPLDFIPIAEQSNLISDITEYVINTALQQKSDWKEEGYCIRKIAINISPNSMNTLGFCYYIEDKLMEYGIKGEELILELTESTFIEDLKDLDINIKYLRSLGVEIALDDFGTGYSTLARLKELNIDYLKLDRTFIMNMTKDSNDASLVKSVIGVANVLYIEVCAEGIETLESLNLLTEMGCSLGQGYIIHKPSDKLPLDFKYNICN